MVSWSLDAGREPVEWIQKCFPGGNYLHIWDDQASFRCTLVYNVRQDNEMIECMLSVYHVP